MSRHLHRRLSALEAFSGDGLQYLSDEAISARMVEVCEQIESHADYQPGMLPDNWRGLIAAENWKAFERQHAQSEDAHTSARRSVIGGPATVAPNHCWRRPD